MIFGCFCSDACFVGVAWVWVGFGCCGFLGLGFCGPVEFVLSEGLI